jgi:DNA-directed RNA polymerase specialized sigma24 family protein
MSEHDRKVLTMTLLDEKSNEEASRELNIGHSSFRVTLHRARGRFRKQIAFMLGMPLSSGMLTATE